ncbi:MAG: PQQ-like beta-propeller repeat protein, partial [Planctomycetota bacterium]|nr:PQQ-like beta-propeller repeat protein [Planctomycetota bacterium]
MPPSGAWVANAGNLGLVVWAADGKKLWSRDWWQDHGARQAVSGQDCEGHFYTIGPARQSLLLLAPNDDILIALDGNMLATAYGARSGEQIWQAKLASAGIIQGGAASADGRTVAVNADTGGGRVFILRDGKIATTLYCRADLLRLTPDGRFLAVVDGNELRWYAADGTFLWRAEGDDASPVVPSLPSALLNEPRISADGKRVVFGTATGMLYVLDDQGRIIFSRDLLATPVATWLPGNELLVATWMGEVLRLDAKGVEKWRVRVQGQGHVRDKIAADATPTVRMPWGNAASETAPLQPNLLRDVPAKIFYATYKPPYSQFGVFQNPVEMLCDGQTAPPPKPWLDWQIVQITDSGWTGKMALTFD